MTETGTIARQSTCIAIDGRAVLIEGPSGSGKSSLALELIDRGASLVGDDAVLLETRGTQLFASPHPRTCGLIEIRNLGLVHYPVVHDISVALLIVLDEQAPRFIEAPEPADVQGVALPMVRLWPRSGPLPIKVERALATFGLSAASPEAEYKGKPFK